MEEKKIKTQKTEKLTYEQLEAAANQISEQARALYNENMALKKRVEALTMNDVFAQLELRFKVLNYSKLFPEEFVVRVIKEIVDTMTPEKEETKETPKEDK